MEDTLFNSKGEPVAYISSDMNKTIYLWDGHPVAYLYSYHVYGFNGRIVYDPDGNRIGFNSATCPVAVYKEPSKGKKYPVDKIWSRYEAPALPELGFNYSAQDFVEFLRGGQVLL
jgi:hypothetical protein